MEEVLRAFISALRFHKLGGNVTCGGALEVGCKETTVWSDQFNWEKNKTLVLSLFLFFFFLFPHFFMTFTSLMEMIN